MNIYVKSELSKKLNLIQNVFPFTDNTYLILLPKLILGLFFCFSFSCAVDFIEFKMGATISVEAATLKSLEFPYLGFSLESIPIPFFHSLNSVMKFICG